MIDKQNITDKPVVPLDEGELLGLRQFSRVSAADAGRSGLELSKLLSKVGEIVPG